MKTPTETPKQREVRLEKAVRAIIRTTKRKVGFASKLQKLGMSEQEAARTADLPESDLTA